MPGFNSDKPHDSFFKGMMRQKKVAQQYLQLFAPSDLIDATDLASLTVYESAYFTLMRDSLYADVVYKANFLDGTGEIYFLLEHQSSPDESMALRLANYTCLIQDDGAAFDVASGIGGDAKPRLKVPMVVSVVLFQVGRRTVHSTDLKEYLAGPRSIVEKYAFAPPILVNLNDVPDTVCREKPLAGIMAWILKHLKEGDVLKNMRNEHALFEQAFVEGGEKSFAYVLFYILAVADEALKEQLLECARSLVPNQLRRTYMTAYEAVQREGYDKSREELTAMRNELDGTRSELDGTRSELDGTRRRFAKHLLNQGQSLDEVCKLTGLAPEELTTLH